MTPLTTTCLPSAGRMRPFTFAMIAALQACAAVQTDGPGILSGGVLTTTEEMAVVEQVVRFGVANTTAPCANHGAKDAYCLRVGSSEQPADPLLSSLSDVRPAVLPLAACRSGGLVGPVLFATDPVIRVEWLRSAPGGAIQARVVVYCYVSEPLVQRQGARWVVRPSGWIGSCGIPGDCVRQEFGGS